MFKRIVYENWHSIVPIVAFVLTFAVFLIASVRALLANKASVQRLAALPLDDAASEKTE